MQTAEVPFNGHITITTEVLPIRISFTRTSTWNIRLFPEPFGSTASRSPRDTSVRIGLVCSVRNSRYIPKWDRHWRAFSRAESKFSSDSVIFLFKKLILFPHSRAKKCIDLQFIGRHQSISLRPHQSQTPFVGERRFSKKQWLPASVFFLPLPLLRYFSFQPHSHTLGRIFVSPQASSEFESKMALAWSNALARNLAKIRLHCRLRFGSDIYF